jgi:nitrogen fixation NifU-like protein
MEPQELYQQVILDHSRRPRHYGPCEGETHASRVVNPTCGDEVAVHLRVGPGGLVEEATFTGQGCALSRASASLMACRVRGGSVADALRSAASVGRLLAGEGGEEYQELGDISVLITARQYPRRLDCVRLAWVALRRALEVPVDGGG